MDSDLRHQIAAEQLRAHYALLPAIAVAPTAGGAYVCWVLWDAVPRSYLITGVGLLVGLALTRLWMFRAHRRSPTEHALQRRWRLFAVGMAFGSGCLWGSAAFMLHPPLVPEYAVFVLVLLALVPIIPMAALAVWMPAFYAYFVPSSLPFVAVLATTGRRAEVLTALLLLMVMAAVITFARRYAHSLAAAIELRLRLARQAGALEQAVELKSQFVAAASHDLWQPAQAMALFFDALGEGRKSAPMANMEASLHALRRMLADMQVLARLDAQAPPVNFMFVRASALLEPLAAEFGPLAERVGLRLRLRVQDAGLRTDPALTERMLRNLLANAIKFTAHGGVLLACRAHGELVRLQVFDTGGGIAPDDLGRVFAPYVRGPQDGRRAEGMGLGLAIVQRLADLTAQRLGVRSAVGRGTAFTIEVARAAPPS